MCYCNNWEDVEMMFTAEAADESKIEDPISAKYVQTFGSLGDASIWSDSNVDTTAINLETSIDG